MLFHFCIFVSMFKILIFFTVIFLFVSCDSNQVNGSEAGSKDSSYTELKLEYAENFRIYKSVDRFKLEILDPDKKSVEKVFYFDTKIPENKVFSGNLLSLSSTTNGMLVKLGCVDELIGISSINYVFSSEIKKGFKSGKIKEYGDESSYSPENLVKSGVKIVLYSGFGKEFPNDGKLNEFGINTIPLYDWRETHPLGKAEWIKFAGIICGKYNEAVVYFENVKNQYLALSKLTKDVSEKPKVVSGNLFGDSWNAPGGGSYMAKIFEDAGADYRYKDNKQTGSNQYSLERILAENQESDYWFNPGFSRKSEILNVNDNLRFLPPFKDHTYCYSGNMSKYWEYSAIEPHKVLSDLVVILHPELLPGKKLYFYKKIDD